jgi:uncharacterized phage infection (PIP) family protein YhgE
MTKRHRIRKLRLYEISLVDHPAEPNAMIHFFKRGDPGQEDKGMPENLENLVKQMETATATITELTKAKETADGEIAKRDKEITDLKVELDKARAAAPAAEGEDLLKSIGDPKVRAAFEEMQKRADAANKLVAKMADEKAEAGFVDEVRKSYTALPIKAEEFGPVLKRVMTSISDEDGKELRRVLKAADALAKSGATAVAGVRGAPLAGTAEAEIEAKAHELAKSSSGKINFAAAYDQILKSHPDLYGRYLEETGQAIN